MKRIKKNYFLQACVLLVLLIILLTASCTRQRTLASSPITEAQLNSEGMFNCTLDNTTYTFKSKVFYHLDNKNRAHIDIKDGSYIQKEDKTGWTFKRTVQQNTSFYRHLEEDVIKGTTAWKTPVQCVVVGRIPENFVRFLVTHPFVAYKYLNENDTQTNETGTA